MFQWDEEEDEGDTRERVTLGYHEEGEREIKVEGKQVTFFLCCHQSIEMIKEENVLRQGEQRNDNLAGSGGKHHTYVEWQGVCVWMCVGQFKKDPDPTGRKRQALAKLLYTTKFNIKVFRMLLEKVK